MRDYSMWDVLLPLLEECDTLMKKDLQNKECIFKVSRKRWTRVTWVYKIPGLSWAIFQLLYGKIVEISPDIKMGEKRFNLMINKKIFNDMPKWLDMHGQKLLETGLIAM